MKYVLGSLIGKGSDGEVYNLIDKDRTIKFIQPSNDYGFENYVEAYILLNLKHINLMFAYEIEIEESGLIKIVQDKATCDLGKMLYGPHKLNNNNKIKFIKQLVSGVAFLHSHNIIHGDLKPSNLLIVKNKLLLNDFSMARINCDQIERTNRKLYTYMYRPPECNLNKYSLKSDIYALGCTIYEIYYNQPYFSLGGDNRLYHIHAQNYYNTQNSEINNLIKTMINDSVADRINIEIVCNFFNLETPKKKMLKICLNITNKVFINKIEHILGKIKMNDEEKKKEINIFQTGMKIFNIGCV